MVEGAEDRVEVKGVVRSSTIKQEDNEKMMRGPLILQTKCLLRVYIPHHNIRMLIKIRIK
jgi:hypothetical protein